MGGPSTCCFTSPIRGSTRPNAKVAIASSLRRRKKPGNFRWLDHEPYWPRSLQLGDQLIDRTGHRVELFLTRATGQSAQPSLVAGAQLLHEGPSATSETHRRSTKVAGVA